VSPRAVAGVVPGRQGRREEVIPSAARLLSSLRDLGYSFSTAIADLVDNSISAGASRVDITLHPDGPDSWIRVADNGTGMDAAAISEAMRLGAGGRDYEADELGKFGLGLKTASLSQARSVTVASRTHASRRLIDVRQLDLDDVISSDRWWIHHPAADDRPPAAVEGLHAPGTVVLWTKLDRILTLRDHFGGYAARELGRLAGQVDEHLGMVFGRFITGDAVSGQDALVITVNGEPVPAWDPFCLNENTHVLPEREIPVAGGIVRVRPYVLPRQGEFTTDEAWRTASGPNQWNNQQGLYIYRGNRLIQSGGWSWLRGNDEHVKLARVAVDFRSDLDDAFEINISKMRVKLPQELREAMRTVVAEVSRAADTRYRRSDRPVPARPAAGRSGGRTTSPPPAGGDGGGGTGDVRPPPVTGAGDPARPVTPPHPSGGRGVGDALTASAREVDAADALGRIRRHLKDHEPEAARELGW